MFTGIIEELGTVRRLDVSDGRGRLEIACSAVLAGSRPGDSISVNGCCLTVTELGSDGFAADLMAETLGVTALGRIVANDPVNLERALAAGERLGGHLVQGHVDAVGRVVARDERPGTVTLSIEAPAAVGPYLVPKGSVTVDGASLTVIDVHDDVDLVRFEIGLIPHTLSVTTFGRRQPGDEVNIEVDVIAKYVERMLAGGSPTPYRSDRGGPL